MPTKKPDEGSVKSLRLVEYNDLYADMDVLGCEAMDFVDKHEALNRYEIREYNPTLYDVDDYINNRMSCLTFNDNQENLAVFGTPQAIMDLERLAAIGLMEVLKRHQSRSRSQKSKRTPSSGR
jgi:hypothetical protein